MSEPIAYALVWLGLAALLLFVNIRAGETWLKLASIVGLLASIAMTALTLLGIVAVGS